MVTETDIGNRALQRVGCERIAAGQLWQEDSKNASEIRACYQMLRRAELNRNVWRFSIRSCALRPIGINSKLLVFGTFNIATTYSHNDIVTGSDGQVYQSLISGNVGNDPTLALQVPTPAWTLYFGNMLAQEFVAVWSGTTTYAQGDHSQGSDGQIYTSLVNTNLNYNPVGDGAVHWDLATNVNPDDSTQLNDTDYYAGELLFLGPTVYVSVQNQNADIPPSSKWLPLTTAAAMSLAAFIYPIGAGPSQQRATKNVYRLPNGFMRIAPQDPLAGASLFLGAPGGLAFKDWEMEGDYFTTRDSEVILFRFAADVADPTKFNPMFCEGLGSRIAFEICEPLTQSAAKLQAIASEYKNFMSEARTVNGIETGPTYPPEDDYISCRA